MHAVSSLGETRRKMRPKNKARTVSGGDVCDESESGATNMGVHGPTAPLNPLIRPYNMQEIIKIEN